MSSPLAHFRRYQKLLLALFGVLLIFVFTVSSVQFSMGPQSGGVGQDIVATWNGGTIRESELMGMRRAHILTVRFLEAVVQETVSLKGTPKAQPIQFARTDQQTVLTMLLAKKAKAMGLVVNDEAIKDYLRRLSDSKLLDGDYARLLEESSGGDLTQDQLFDQLRLELLAQNMQFLAFSGIGAIPPAAAWDLYTRVHRRATSELAGLNVADYVDKIASEPTEDELEALFNQYKDVYPNPISPEPGFRKRKRIAFEYLTADFQKLLDEEIAKVKDQITAQEIEEFYNKEKDRRYKALELPSTPDAGAETAPATEKSESGGEQPEATTEKPESDVKKDESEASTEKPEASTEKPEAGTEKPEAGTEKPEAGSEKPEAGSEKPETGTEKPEAGVEKPAKAEAEDSVPAPPPIETTPGEKSEKAGGAGAGDNGQGSVPPATPAADSSGDSTCGQQDQPPSPDSTPAPGDTRQGASDQQGAEGAPNRDAPDQPAVPDKEDAPPQESPRKGEEEEKKEAAPSASDTPPQQPETTTPPASQPEAAATPESSAESEAKAQYKPLDDELRGEIRQELAEQRARKPAQDRLDKALEAAKAELDAYFRGLTNSKAVPGTAPEPLDVEKLAAKHGFTSGTIPLVDELEVGEYDLGKAFDISFEGGQVRTISFSEIVFNDSKPLFKADRIKTFGNDVEYLYWKTEEEDEGVPTFEEARPEVLRVWQMQQALPLARKAAEELAAKANQADKPLSEVFADEKNIKVTDSNSFSWMTSGAVSFGTGEPSISPVDGVDRPGNEFMQTVFGLTPGKSGVAVNAPQTQVYVVRLVSLSPNEELLRQMFLASRGSSQEVQLMAAQNQMRILDGWYRDLEREMNLQWMRNPS